MFQGLRYTDKNKVEVIPPPHPQIVKVLVVIKLFSVLSFKFKNSCFKQKNENQFTKTIQAAKGAIIFWNGRFFGVEQG
jgi:hypothetical protein